ncbi:MAG: glutamate racemase [Flavobacteriaceae bacterium]
MNNPIGLFDSGVGGTSIWKQIHTLLPNEDTIYLADSKNAPYGYKTKEEIIALSFKNTEFLLNQNAKLIVVACNTATTSAIEELREKYDVPFIGIEHALKPAALQSKVRKVGVLATQRTINSELFAKTRANFPEVTFVEQIGFELVQLIEAGKMESEKMEELLKEYLRPMLKAQVDCLVLGCTHYPYLIPQIEKLIPPTIQIIDSGKAVAQQTQKILQQNNLLNLSDKKGQSVFYTNADKTVLQNLIGKESLVLNFEF